VGSSIDAPREAGEIAAHACSSSAQLAQAVVQILSARHG
jgi:hypothetical protein